MQQPKIQNSNPKIKIISVNDIVPQSEIQQRPSIPRNNNTFRTIQQNSTKNSVQAYSDSAQKVIPQKQIRSISSNADINQKMYVRMNEQIPIKESNHQPNLSTQINKPIPNQFQPPNYENKIQYSQQAQARNYQNKIQIQSIQSQSNNTYCKNLITQTKYEEKNQYENQLSDQPSDLAESLARSISYKCKLCDINIHTDIIQLACFHFYHKECFIQHIDSQINAKQCEIKCYCGIKIKEGEIKKFLSFDNKSKQIEQLLRLQLKQIYFKYNCFQQCSNCGFFWKANQKNSQLPCKQCTTNIQKYK